MTPDEVLTSFHHHKIIWEICIYGAGVFIFCAFLRNPLLFLLIAGAIVALGVIA
jgi:hypothetical protein